MTATARSFAALAARINEPQNPRIAAGISSQAWERARKARRRAEWEARASTHAATAVATKPVRDLVSFEDSLIQRLRAESCLERSVPLEIDIPARPERGPNAGRYFADKWNRLGTLGQHESLNPWIERLRKEVRR
jgi:hypothetical protein